VYQILTSSHSASPAEIAKNSDGREFQILEQYLI